jgi:hypothetical protein
MTANIVFSVFNPALRQGRGRLLCSIDLLVDAPGKAKSAAGAALERLVYRGLGGRCQSLSQRRCVSAVVLSPLWFSPRFCIVAYATLP